jgi:hypothetical protein
VPRGSSHEADYPYQTDTGNHFADLIGEKRVARLALHSTEGHAHGNEPNIDSDGRDSLSCKENKRTMHMIGMSEKDKTGPDPCPLPNI